MPISQAAYCSEVCQAKCCYGRSAHEGVVRCPQLRDDNLCGVYDRRYAEGQPRIVKIGSFRSRVLKDLDGEFVDMPFFCGFIEDILKRDDLPRDVKEKCCFHNPKVLEENEI